MIDDDYTLDEGDLMPDPYWRLPDTVPVIVRVRTSHLPTAPLLAVHTEFYRVSSVFGPRYLSLYRLTCFDAYRRDPPERAPFDELVGAHPDTFTTVLGRRPDQVWLALRLTRLTDAVADTIIAVHARTTGRP